jgi:hypothetical protein
MSEFVNEKSTTVLSEVDVHTVHDMDVHGCRRRGRRRQERDIRINHGRCVCVCILSAAELLDQQFRLRAAGQS